MNDQTDTREIIVLQNRSVEDSAAIAGILARRLVLELVNCDGRLALLDNGRLVEVTNPRLAELVSQHVLTVRHVYDGGLWTAELYQLSLDRQQLNDIVAKLLLLVAQVKGQTKELSDQIKSNIRSRVLCGEPKIAIAKYYHDRRGEPPGRSSLEVYEDDAG